jgi:hypothetical protein
MCRAAVMVPVRELVPYREDGSLTSLDLEALDVGRCRKVKMRDFEAAMARVRLELGRCVAHSVFYVCVTGMCVCDCVCVKMCM